MHQDYLAAATRWQMGRSPLGGTPPKDMSVGPAVPAAPGVASRTKPGVVPRRTRQYRPEVTSAAYPN